MSAPASHGFAAGLLAAVGLGAGAVGCTDGDLDEYPVVPGAGSAAGPAEPGGVLRARVCVAGDLRRFGDCAPSGAGGLAVSVDGRSTVTEADGSFELGLPESALGEGGADVMITGPGVFPTFTPLSAVRGGGGGGAALVAAIDADVYARELSTNGVLLPDGSGAILGRVLGGEGPATGIGVTSAPASPFGPFYDGVDAFTLDSTGARGVFFVPGLAAGAANLTFRDAAGANETLVNGVMVRNGGITILDSVALP